ncbi:hypothetical protein C0991_002171, partial [Blastosporella zonata]
MIRARSSSPSQPQLPSELISQIIDELSGNWRTLQACSLAASIFRELSQKILFKSLTIDLKKKNASANTRLDNAMSLNEKLGTYVQTLHLQVRPNCQTRGILKRLSLLRSLNINGLWEMSETMYTYGQRTEWPELPHGVQQDILDLLRTRTLEKLTFSDLSGFPLGFLKRCPHLKDLRLLVDSITPDALVDYSGGQPYDASLTRGYLESLTIVEASATQVIMDTLNDPTSLLSLSCLQRFNTLVIQSERDTTELKGVMDLAAASLEVIGVSLLFLVDSPHDAVVDISKLVKLRVICVRTGRPACGSLCFATAMFETIPEQNVVEELQLKIAGDVLERDDEEALGALDDLLTRERHAKRLRRVLVMTRSHDDDQIRSVVLQKLTKLKFKGLLEFQLKHVAQ